ncbi:hypothetical protein [Piscinibacter koreensis]|uniref:Lectin n=1 Tax=Piscinibacter koreensis TaxID=2742824 RepID=A0A7Y6NPX2_9BURK|nr:hypothetical protein [Schlegelella koreensis]NUZ07072.1 hypothetical protein [Schlegelella koreensis]
MRATLKRQTLIAAAVVAVAGIAACGNTPSQPGQGSGPGMSFFVTSAGSGKGADLGGLAGADRICQTLAASAGAGSRTWRAYLSAQPAGGTAGVNARDRIGRGPWHNAKGQLIASDVAALHGAGNNINKQTALTEKGATVNGRGDTPNMHDVLTGSQPDGTFISGNVDSTCRNWTHSGPDGAAMVGHHDRMGLDDSAPAKSWNSSHLSRGGCSQDALKGTGGAGLLYCFAAN